MPTPFARLGSEAAAVRAAALALGTITIVAALLSGCSGQGSTATTLTSASASRDAQPQLPGAGRPAVTIGDKNFTEQFILGQLYSQALSARGYTVVLNRDIGPTEVTLQALASGSLSMYPEYVGVWNSAVAGYRHTFGSAAAALAAAHRFARSHALELLAPTPFSDTPAIAVTVSYAWDHGLRTIGDLRKVAADLTLGAPPQFEQSPSGLPALEQAYGFVPRLFKALAIGDQYRALDTGAVQAADVASTDGQLGSGNYRLLGDPAHVFGYGYVVPVVPARVLQIEGPDFARTIDQVSALLTSGAMRELNAAVDVYDQDPAHVAKEFLLAHGLLPSPAG